MDRGLFNETIEEQIELCRSVLVDKGEEYTPGDDRLSNFRQAAAAQNITMKQALAGMMAKHTISIYDMIWTDEDADMDKWEEKIGDHLNYLLILKAILIEEQLDRAEGAPEETMRQAMSALATAQGKIPTMPISSPNEVPVPDGIPGEFVDPQVFDDRRRWEQARKEMPTIFGRVGGQLDEKHESD